jgi:phosphoesterase RecJ-like protein
MQLRQDLRQQLDATNTVALFVHRSPDGDCLGSGLALGSILEAQGKQVSYYCPTPYGEVFTMFPKVQDFSTTFDYGEYDLLLFLDTAAPQQISYFREGHEDYFAKQHKIVIDHHISNP